MEGSADLRKRWRSTVARLGAVPSGSDPVLRLLVGRYSEPHRRYHTLHHVADVLEHVDELITAGEPVVDPVAVELAAWFHDAIYQPGGPDNEARSAQLATEALSGLGLDTSRVERVADLVLATARHVPDGPDAAVLCDADLAVLGRDREGYLRYARQIRSEWSHLDDARYRRGRIAVLRGFLERPLPYHTRSMRSRRGAALAENIRDEIDRLSDDARPVDAVLHDVAV